MVNPNNQTMNMSNPGVSFVKNSKEYLKIQIYLKKKVVKKSFNLVSAMEIIFLKKPECEGCDSNA
jgi:hypothetical protein